MQLQHETLNKQIYDTLAEFNVLPENVIEFVLSTCSSYFER